MAAGNMNRRKAQSSRYRGVGWDKSRNKWAAKISYYGRTINLGRFVNEKEAAVAYNIKALELFGEYSHLNRITA